MWYRERACAEVELPRVRGGWAAHKTKQAMTKHLALLASLGKLGLSEHMMLEADLRTQERKVSATLSTGLQGRWWPRRWVR